MLCPKRFEILSSRVEKEGVNISLPFLLSPHISWLKKVYNAVKNTILYFVPPQFGKPVSEHV
jgi:hypothetical protein